MKRCLLIVIMTAALSNVYSDLISPEYQSVLMVYPDAGVSTEIALQHLNLPIRSLITISHHIFEQFIHLFQCSLVRLKL